MLISEYRPLFTQPFNLRRFEADAARQAAAQAAAAAAAEAALGSSPPLGSPLLTPIRCERLSVMHPEGDSPFSDCLATPLAPESPLSAFLAAAAAAAAGAPAVPSPASFAALQSAPRAPFGSMLSLGGAASLGGSSSEEGDYESESDPLELAFSSLLQDTVSGMLFDSPPPACEGLGAAKAAPGASLADADDQPMSPVGVLREVNSDGGDSGSGGWLRRAVWRGSSGVDGQRLLPACPPACTPRCRARTDQAPRPTSSSHARPADCDAPMAGAGRPGQSPFAWARPVAC